MFVRSHHWWKQFRELILVCLVHNLDKTLTNQYSCSTDRLIRAGAMSKKARIKTIPKIVGLGGGNHPCLHGTTTYFTDHTDVLDDSFYDLPARGSPGV